MTTSEELLAQVETYEAENAKFTEKQYGLSYVCIKKEDVITSSFFYIQINL